MTGYPNPAEKGVDYERKKIPTNEDPSNITPPRAESSSLIRVRLCNQQDPLIRKATSTLEDLDKEVL
jgi:hypothetical protein